MPAAGVAWHVVKSVPQPLLVACATGWAILAGRDAGPSVPDICLSAQALGESASIRVAAALAVAAPFALASAWLLMLVAMMPPLLAGPLRHVWHRSLTRRRVRAAALFLAGYVFVWLAAGAVLTVASLVLGSVALAAAVPALCVAAVISLAWQATPLKQRCLNRCHRKPPLAAFGLRAEADAFRYGATHGAWCVGSCWALMLVPLAAPAHLHWPGMAALMIMLVVERAGAPTLPRWGAALPPLPRRSRAMPTMRGTAA